MCFFLTEIVVFVVHFFDAFDVNEAPYRKDAKNAQCDRVNKSQVQLPGMVFKIKVSKH